MFNHVVEYERVADIVNQMVELILAWLRQPLAQEIRADLGVRFLCADGSAAWRAPVIFPTPEVKSAENFICYSSPPCHGGAMKRIGSALLAIAALAAGTATPAYADDDDARGGALRVSEAQAVRIARGYGMVRVTEVERDDGGWEVEGRDRRGREVKVTINRLGRVTKVERGDDNDG
jgi:hypothetical protein